MILLIGLFATILSFYSKMIGVTLLMGLVATFLGYIYYIQKLSKFGVSVDKFPGPSYIPIIGNTLDMRKTPVKIFDQFRNFTATFKGTYRLWTIHHAMVNITTAEDAEILLTSNKHIRKSMVYQFLQEWLGTGLLTATGGKWQKRRKLLTPAFHFNILRKFTETFGEHAQNLVEDLKAECTKPHTNVQPFITNTTLQAICETAMGTTVDPKDKIQRSYFQSIYDMGALVVYRITTPWLYNNNVFKALPIGWRFQKLINNLHRFTTGVIKEREANFKDSDVENLDKEDDETMGKKKRLAMLDLLISAKKNKGSIDDEGIREEVDTFMFEGHDTTSAALSFALMVLANHKEHQVKIQQEMDEIFGNDKRPATYDDLHKMQYLELCLKESLRLYPSVPLIGRSMDEDLHLTNCIAPAGCVVNIHIYDLHHDAKHFPDPMKYDPERFLPENSKGRHPFAYIPFSAGARNCIGQKFAMLEMKSIISAVLRNYNLEPIDTPDSMRLKLDFVLRTETEVNVRFTPRT